MIRKLVFAALMLCSGPLYARDGWVNPETMGANALAAPAAEAPWTQPNTEATIGVAAQWGRRYDASFSPTFRLAAPFGSHVTALMDGMPIEAWWSSAQTRDEWALPRAQGVTKADIRFGVKFLLFDGAARGLPAIAFRAITKTTTGKDYDTRRFIDAPAYVLDGSFGQRWLVREQLLISAYGNAGFFAWQQGADGQNDAFEMSAAMSLYWLNVGRLELETRGYSGWQRGDKVIVQSLRLFVDATSWLTIGGTVNVGFLSAPRLEGRLDFTFRFPALVPWVLQ